MFIYSDTIHNSQIVTNIGYVDIFAVFGFNQGFVELMNASINVSINTIVGKCALICIKCDIQVTKSTLILNAQGQIIAGLALEIEIAIQLTQSSIQIRMKSPYGAGIIQSIAKPIEIFNVFDTNISASSLLTSENNGYLVSQLNITQDIQIQNVLICSSLQATGHTIYQLNQSQSLQHNCNICEKDMIVYGLCMPDLLFGQIVNDTLQCVPPFEFNGSSCNCQSGYELNVTICINTIKQLTLLEEYFDLSVNSLNSSINSLQQSFSQDLLEFKNQTLLMHDQLNKIFDNNIISNISAQESKFRDLLAMYENYTNSSLNALDTRLFNNISSTTIKLEDYIQRNISQVNSSVLSRIQLSDERVIQNISQVEQYVNTTRDKTEQYIIQNITNLRTQLLGEQNTLANNIVQNIVTNSSILEQRIISNASSLQSQMVQLSTDLQNDIRNVQNQAHDNLTNCINSVNTNFNNNISTLKSYVDSKIFSSDQFVISNVSQLEQFVNSTRDAIEQRTQGNISNLKAQLQSETNTGIQNTVQQIVQNSTTLEQRIIGNATQLQNNMNIMAINQKADLEALRLQADSNLTSSINALDANINNNLTALNSSLLSQLLSNSTSIEQRILSNVTTLNNNFTSQTTSINQDLTSTKSQQTVINQDITGLKQIVQYFGDTVCAFSFKTYSNGACY
ncbi:Conserved_hypothetical protein [Hexamita inflata]|uniref:Uncharacterized protein n=1 Tax=Hexamita inflata TaxID=28002 RepID=A0AA86PMS7_9EUKA|nr:Conserved hypothetical protein [Hexamita inflata]